MLNYTLARNIRELQHGTLFRIDVIHYTLARNIRELQLLDGSGILRKDYTLARNIRELQPVFNEQQVDYFIYREL